MTRYKSLIACLPFAFLVACTTAEERMAFDADRMFANGSQDYAHLCGSIAAMAIEHGRKMGADKVQATIADARVINQTSNQVEVTTHLKMSAAGYSPSLVNITCQFDPTDVVADRWPNLVAMQFDGEPVNDEGLVALNALGTSLAGHDLHKPAS